MKPVLAALMGLLMMTSACRKEQRNNTNNTPPGATQARLKQILETNKNGDSRQQTFLYNGKGYLQAYTLLNKPKDSIGWRTDVNIIFEYDANNRVAYENWSSPVAGSYKGQYTYDEQGKLVQVKYIDKNEAINHRVVYTYHNKKPITVTTHDGTGKMMESHSFLYNSFGNVTWHTTNYRTFDNPETKADNTGYDGLPNYVQTVKGLENYLYIFGLNAQTFSNNNLVSNILKYPGGSETTEYRHTYNRYGHVEKEIMNNGERTRTFTYEEIE